MKIILAILLYAISFSAFAVYCAPSADPNYHFVTGCCGGGDCCLVQEFSSDLNCGGGIPYSSQCYIGSCSGGFPPVNPNPNPATTPSDNGGVVSALLATGAAAFAILAGIGLAIGAAPILITGAVSIAAHMAVAAVVWPSAATTPGYGSGISPATVQAAFGGSNVPMQVSFQPASSPVPAPAVGDTAPPSIATTANGNFAPTGGGLMGGGATAGWAPGGATGEWTYTPPATSQNPTPQPTLAITNGGWSINEQIAPTSSGTSTGSLIVTKNADSGYTVTASSQVPVVTADGQSTTVPAAVTAAYDSTGALVTGAGQAVGIGPTLANGSSSGSGSSIAVSPGSGGGTGGGTGSGSGGGGSCGGVGQTPCAVVSGTFVNPADPDVTAMQTSINSAVRTNTFSSLLSPSFSSSAGTCPVITLHLFDHDMTASGHCQIVESNRAIFSSIFLLIWAFTAMLIVLKA